MKVIRFAKKHAIPILIGLTALSLACMIGLDIVGKHGNEAYEWSFRTGLLTGAAGLLLVLRPRRAH
jgi:hypothetical protein